MRGAGVIHATSGFGRCDHACWAYRTEEERRGAVVPWLVDGLAAGQRALYVADLDRDSLLADLAALPGRDEHVANGSLVVLSSSDVYDLSQPIDAPAQLAMYAAVVEQAIGDGYDGVRVAADITVLVRDPDRRRSHARWEHFADHYIATHPLAPLCLYDATVVHDIAPIVAVHPLQGGDGERPPFTMYAADGEVVVEGEVDALVADLFDEVLSAIPDEREVTLRLGGLQFIDGRGAAVLHTAIARRHEAGPPLRVEDTPRQLERIWELLGIS